MTELYPLLTVQNVNYWYWEVEPHWSAIDIAKAVGCGRNTVYNFMKRKNIPKRSRSKANLNRFNCPHKYKTHIKQRQSEEFRASQSLIAYDIMWKPEIRERYLKAFKEANKGILSAHQKLILFLLTTHKALFVTDFLRMIKGDLKTIDHSIHALHKRQFVERVKAINPNTFNNYKSHYTYSITKKGETLITRKLKDKKCKFKELLQDENPKKKDKKTLQREFIQRENIGKNQLIILKTIQKNGSKFLLDLVSILRLPKRTIDSSLRSLSSRGFFDKEKKENPNYQGNNSHRKQYYYSITDKCPKLL